jgi:hypothetical protein
MKLGIRTASVALVMTTAATACGGGSSSEASAPIIVQDQPDIVIETTSTTIGVTPIDAEIPAVPQFDTTDDGIPDEEEDPDGEFFDSVGDFFQCLTTEGYDFIGIPNGGDEADPVNDPSYGQALGSCAASTQIIAKMQAADDTSDLTAEEIEEQNRNFTIFVDCLTGRGWTIPPLTPDENGVLQPPYVELAQTWQTPDGGSIVGDGELQADDLTGCGFNPSADGGGVS